MRIGRNACTRRPSKNLSSTASSPVIESESDFASAVEQGFRSGGWKNALLKGSEVRQRQRKIGYYPAYRIAELYANLGDRDQTFQWLNTAYQERDRGLIAFED